MSTGSPTTSASSPEIPSGDLYIGGEWRPGRGEEIAVLNPADLSTIRVMRLASVDDVDQAVARAAATQRDSDWSRLLPHERARHLHRIADGLEANRDRIAAVQTADTGKTLAETRALAASAAGTFRYMAAALETLDEDLTTPRGSYLTMSVWEPMGVIAAITPWNSPIASDAQKVAPALAAGNAVVLKPATWAPLTALELARVCEEAGLPSGLLSVIPGRGSDVGDRLVEHPDVAKVSFTGGTSTGRGIARLAAEKLMPVSLELGGKSPTIVLDDARVDEAVAGIMFGIFSSTGQSCVAGSRCFVQESIYDEVVSELVRRTRALRVGLPTDPETQVAPLVHPNHRDHVESYIAVALEEGAEVLCGARRPEGPPFEGGVFLEPTILAGLDNSSRTCQEEIFGPVLAVMPFRDDDDVVRKANDSVYGLAAGLWTSDYRRAWQLSRRLGAGTVWINTYKQLSIAVPFGGVRDSGIGREKGRTGIRSYMHQKSLYWGLNNEPLPWAGQP